MKRSTVLITILLITLITVPAFGQTPTPPPGTGITAPAPIDGLLLQWTGLAGFAAIITLLINVLKTIGIVKDGQAPAWSAGLNLLGMAVLLAMQVYTPGISLQALDSKAAALAGVGAVIFGYIIQLASAKGMQELIKGIPWIGKSFSSEPLTWQTPDPK